jgi:hypothetical protein
LISLSRCGFQPIASSGTLIASSWLDFNDTTPVGGHASDNLGAILAVADT